jgi:beta-lactamase class A
MTLPDITSFASKSLGIQGYVRPANMLHSDETNGILARLYGGTLLNKTDTAYLLSLMKQANYRSYILPSVPTGYTVYHKAGFYLGHENDAAIIVRNSDSKAIALTIYTYGDDTTVLSKTRAKAFAQLTTAALAAYFP